MQDDVHLILHTEMFWKQWIAIVYLGFYRAFDTVSHIILLEKLMQ